MAKTLKTPKVVTPEMREAYLLAVGKALYGRPVQGRTYGISSTSKKMKEGENNG